MTPTGIETPPELGGPTVELPRSRFFARKVSRALQPLATVAAVIVAILFVIAIFGPLLAPHDPNRLDLLAANQSPGGSHLLGTDDQGRDLFSRLLVGARTSLLGAAAVTLISMAIATFLAVTAAWIGGKYDAVVSRAADALFAFPALLLAILAVAAVGRGLVAPVIALSIAYTPYATRLLRAQSVREASLPYIEALRSQGISSMAICCRHLARSLISSIAVLSTLTVGYAILDLAAISYLGLGVQPPNADWGQMVAEGQEGLISGEPLQVLVAGGAIVISVVALNVLGERLGDIFSRGK